MVHISILIYFATKMSKTFQYGCYNPFYFVGINKKMERVHKHSNGKYFCDTMHIAHMIYGLNLDL